MVSLVSVISQFRQFLAGLATTEARIAVTVGVTLFALLVTVVLLPRGLRYGHRLVSARLGSSRLGGALSLLETYVPRTVASGSVRLLQGVVFLAAALAVLVVWGQVETARSLLTSLGESVPLFGRVGLTLLFALLAYVTADQYQRFVARIGREATWLTDHQQEIVIRLGQIVVLVVFGLVVLSVLTDAPLPFPMEFLLPYLETAGEATVIILLSASLPNVAAGAIGSHARRQDDQSNRSERSSRTSNSDVEEA